MEFLQKKIMYCGPFEEPISPQDSTKAMETKILQEPAIEERPAAW